MVEILEQPIRNFHFKVFKANTPNKVDPTLWKSMKKFGLKMVSDIVCIFFAATWAFWKMWVDLEFYLKWLYRKQSNFLIFQ